MRRATEDSCGADRPVQISIHALHEESDTTYRKFAFKAIEISIHALHEESDHGHGVKPRGLSISIHALHEESDIISKRQSHGFRISIHALHEESDRPWRAIRPFRDNFNPRSP